MVGQGNHLHVIYRNQLFMKWNEGKTAREAHVAVFNSTEDTEKFNLKSTRNLFMFFRNSSKKKIEEYLSGKNNRKEKAGRPKVYKEFHDKQLLRIIDVDKRKRLHQINNEFYETFHDEFHSIPSNSTIWRHLKALKKKRVRLNRTNVKKDPQKQLEYLTSISFVEASKIIDMDGIHFHPKDYLEKYGWATVGEEAYALQIIIRGKTYAVHAAVCQDGFLAWRIFDRNVTHNDVCMFIRDSLAPIFPENAFLILDNASNQKHASVRLTMEGYLFGRYFFSSPYSPELKPIERAFSMVRSWIRNHENDFISSIDLINQAFELYSVRGERGHHCRELFRLYEKNHILFLEEAN